MIGGGDSTLDYDELMHCSIDSDELYHYGVKGMKWGVRHDYEPVGRKRAASDEASDRRSSSRSSSGSSSNSKSSRINNQNQNQNLNQNQNSNADHSKLKTALKVGLAATAAVGTYAMLNSGRGRTLVVKGMRALGKDVAFKKNANLAKAGMTTDEIMSSVVSRINPNYGAIGTKRNCRRCTFAYEMSRRGYDVAATKNTNAIFRLGGMNRFISGQSNNDKTLAVSVFKNKKELDAAVKALLKTTKTQSLTAEERALANKYIDSINMIKLTDSSDSSKDIFESLAKQPNGARGELNVTWKTGGGHSVAWEIIDNKPVIFDCQTSKMFDTIEAFGDYGKNISKADFTRLDNVDLNEDIILRWLKNAKH